MGNRIGKPTSLCSLWSIILHCTWFGTYLPMKIQDNFLSGVQNHHIPKAHKDCVVGIGYWHPNPIKMGENQTVGGVNSSTYSSIHWTITTRLGRIYNWFRGRNICSTMVVHNNSIIQCNFRSIFQSTLISQILTRP